MKITSTQYTLAMIVILAIVVILSSCTSKMYRCPKNLNDAGLVFNPQMK